MRSLAPHPEHEVAFQDIQVLLDKHADKMTAMEVLAIAANLVGKLIAFQDQRCVTPAGAMEIVHRNIEEGNRQALEHLSKGAAGSA